MNDDPVFYRLGHIHDGEVIHGMPTLLDGLGRLLLIGEAVATSGDNVWLETLEPTWVAADI